MRESGEASRRGVLPSTSVRLDVLKVVTRGITSGIPPEQTIGLTLDLSRHRFPGLSLVYAPAIPGGAFLVAHAREAEGHPRYLGKELPLGRFPGALARLEGQVPVSFDDLRTDPTVPGGLVDELGAVALLLVPVAHSEVLRGVIGLLSPERRTWADGEAETLSEIADFVSMALRDAQTRADRERAEQELRESRERFRQIAENVREVFWLGDPHRRRLLYVSPQFEAIWGRSVASLEASPLSWFDAVHPLDRDRVLGAVRGQRASEEFDETYRIVRPDGSIRWIWDRAFPVRDEGGGVHRFAGLAEDVTRQREAEEALREQEGRLRMAQKMEAVGQLAGGVAHDFNNVLVAILGFADLTLEALDEGSPVRRNVQEIRSAGERAAELTRQLLAFGRRQVIAPVVLDLNRRLVGVQSMLQRVIGEHIELVLELSPDAGRVRGDPTQIEQVVMNLAVNARDAMPRGGSLVIETANADLDEGFALAHPGSRPGPQTMLAVSDTGEGMSRETQARIFEPFFTTKGEGKGTGLGLSTVYGIAKQNGWYVAVYSEVGKGTTFKVFMPRVADATGAMPTPASADTPVGGTETVLLAEDDPVVRDLVRQVLSDLGYRVLVAKEPEDAVAIAGAFEGDIDVLVTDVVMPRLNGPEVARQVRAKRPGVGVLFMSGYTDRVVELQGIDPEFPFLQKPFSPRALAKKVREVLSGRG